MSNTSRPHAGESIIRRAFYRSLTAVLILVVAGVAINHYLTRKDTVPEVVTEAIVSVPVTGETAPPQTPPEVLFTDVTAGAGIDFVHTNGAYGDKLMPETIGSGAAFLDYDNDGDQDLLLVNSSWFAGQAQDTTPTLALYRNDGSGSFSDVTQAAGLLSLIHI